MWKGKTRRKRWIKTKIMIKRGKGGGEEWGRKRRRIEEKRRNRKKNHEDGDDDAVDERERKKKRNSQKEKEHKANKKKRRKESKKKRREKQTTFSLFLSRASITLPQNNTLPFPPFVCFIRHGIASCFIPASFFVSHIINTFLALGPSNAPSCLCASCSFLFWEENGS